MKFCTNSSLSMRIKLLKGKISVFNYFSSNNNINILIINNIIIIIIII